MVIREQTLSIMKPEVQHHDGDAFSCYHPHHQDVLLYQIKLVNCHYLKEIESKTHNGYVILSVCCAWLVPSEQQMSRSSKGSFIWIPHGNTESEIELKKKGREMESQREEKKKILKMNNGAVER